MFRTKKMDEQIKEVSDFLISRSAEESDFHPIDRFFLEPFIEQILRFDRNDFILYNLCYANILYSSSLFLCLPELWNDITIDDILKIVNKITNDFSYFTLIYFTYKYVEIDIIRLVLKLPTITKESKREIKYYIKNQYNNFLKSEMDYFFFDIGAIGVRYDEWMSVKQRLLNDKRVEPALKSLEELRVYVNSI